MVWWDEFEKHKRWFANLKLSAGKNALDESEFRIFKSVISQEQCGHLVIFFFAYWDRLKEVKGGLKDFSWAESKMLSANQIAEILNQLFLKQKPMNQFDFWHLDKDLRNVKCGL